MIQVVCWKWNQPGYRSQFKAKHVNTLRNMVERHLHMPHEVVCITDNAEGIDPRVRVIPLWEAPPITIPNLGKPNCFRRLRAYGEEMRTLIGERFVSIDLDCVITGDITPLVNRTDDFVIWGDTAKRQQYNGSMWLMTAGARREVWDKFAEDMELAWVSIKSSGLIGSDQAWVTIILGHGEEMWTEADGVYSFRNNVLRRPRRDLPKDSRIVFFHGNQDPWDPLVQKKHPWISQHYR